MEAASLSRTIRWGILAALGAVIVLTVAAAAGWHFAQARREAREAAATARRQAQLAEIDDRVARIERHTRQVWPPLDLQPITERKITEPEAAQEAEPEAAQEAVPTEMNLRLKGVVFGAKDPVAFIDEVMVGVGEKVGGFRVVAIRTDGVTVADAEGTQYRLTLDEP